MRNGSFCFVKGPFCLLDFQERCSSISESVCLSVCLSVCSSVCTQLVLYMAIVNIIHNDSLPFLGNEPLIAFSGKQTPHLSSPTPSSSLLPSPSLSQHVHIMFTTCSRHVHDMFMTCSQHVHNIYTTCSQHVHDMFLTCSRRVNNLFTTC